MSKRRMEHAMNISTQPASAFTSWSEEPSARPDRRKIRARIGGLHCSLCTGTIEKALGRLPGVDKVAMSLTHEQALGEYDPVVARPEQFLQTLRDIGYTISDPRKLRPFEEEERDLVCEARRFVLAVVLSVATGEAFQGFRLVKQIVLDKTGTLTEGRPLVREIEAIHGRSEHELLALAAAAEVSSEHPLAQAVVEAAFERGVTPPDVDSFEALPGKGVIARLGSREIVVGNPRFLVDRGVTLDRLQSRVQALEAAGRTVIGVAREGRVLGIIALGDALRVDAVKAIAPLRNAGLKTILVRGENERAAQWVAREVGIEEVHASVLPQDKAAIVRRLQAESRVAMVGDGINDAPALMQADVGIAMGGGTDIAIESADIIVLSNRLDARPVARELSRRSYRKMAQNVSRAFLCSRIGLPSAAAGLIDPIWAMVAMAVSVTAIFFNSLWGTPRLFFYAIRSVGQPIVKVTAG